MADSITDAELEELGDVMADTDYIYDPDSPEQSAATAKFYDRVEARLRTAECSDSSVTEILGRMYYARDGINPDRPDDISADRMNKAPELMWDALVMAMSYAHNTQHLHNSFSAACLSKIRADAEQTAHVVLAIGVGNREWQLRDHAGELGDVTLVMNGDDDNFGHFATTHPSAATELCAGVHRVTLPSGHVLYESRDNYDGCISAPWLGMLRAAMGALHVSVVCGVDEQNCRTWQKAAGSKGLTMPWLYVHGTAENNSRRLELNAPFTDLAVC